MTLLIGIDVGTSSIKAVAYDPGTGQVVAVSRQPTPTHHPRPHWSEFDADELWAGTAAAIRQIVEAVGGGKAIKAISIASMGEAGVPLDARGQPLAPMIAWYDPRTEPQAAWWRQHLDPFVVYDITGQIIEAKPSVNKLMWIRQHQPEVFAAMRHWLCVEDLILWKLSGELVTDHSLASRTMLFDQRQLRWSDVLLDAAGLSSGLFPTARPSGTAVGRITAASARETGLGEHTIVVTGGHDHLVGALAAGATGPGVVLDSTGTAAAIMLIDAGFHPQPALFAAGFESYAFVVPATYVVLGSNNAVGGAVEWLIRLLWGDGGLDIAFAAAAAAPAGSAGALWLPHLIGSGTPQADESSRAALVGVRPEHDRGHVLRAMLEGLAYWLRQNLEVAEASLPTVAGGEVLAIGGATRSPFWTQLKADVTGRSFRVPRLVESVALGAALLAGVGAGVFANSEAAVRSLQVESDCFEPDAATSTDYRRRYDAVYQRLYPALREVSAAIEALQQG
jgi:xylulokinase